MSYVAIILTGKFLMWAQDLNAFIVAGQDKKTEGKRLQDMLSYNNCLLFMEAQKMHLKLYGQRNASLTCPSSTVLNGSVQM